ncbi:MAG: PQQ-binding-like beta-propeller repeat protein [Planctomycetaceae bacterium]
MTHGFRIAVAAAVVCCLGSAGCGPDAVPVQELSTSADAIAPASPIVVSPDDWPWWRGPTFNNVASDQSVPTTWNESQNVVWKTPIPGRGHGSPTVVGDRIFLCTADESQQRQLVLGLDRGTGEQLWETVVHSGGLPGRREMHPKSTHANCTAACDGSRVFVAFLNNEEITATALSTEGDIQWQTKLGHFGSKFGYAPSPCLFESLVIIAADNRGGGFLAAVHRESGEIVWRKARNNVDTYSSAIVTVVAGKPQLLISGDNKVASYDPWTGKELWDCPGTAEATCGTVVWKDNLVYGSGGYPEQQTLCVDAASGQPVWEDGVKCYEQSMLVAGDYLYAVTDDGIAMCWNADTGDRQWRHRLSGPISASPVLVGDLIFATNESGTTWVFRAAPERFEQVAKNQLGTESFASLSICGERIYARVASDAGGARQEFLYCIGDQE